MSDMRSASPQVLNGQWVQRGTVLRFKETDGVEPWPDLSHLIACPTCRAKVTECCRTKTGHRTTPHGSRLAPRLCPCGELLPARARYCDPCRRRANKTSKLESQRRIRAAAKEAA